MVLLTANHGLMRDINKLTVLKLIRRSGPISKAEIAEQTGLNKTTVAACVEELIRDMLVREVGLASKSQGRPPLMLEFNGKDGFVVGAALGVDFLDIIVADLEGNIQYQTRSGMRTDTNEHFIRDIGDAIETVLAQISAPPLGVVGIGVGTPGIVNTGTGEIVQSARYPRLMGVPLQSALEERFQKSVTVEENGNAALAGTYYFGRMKESQTSIFALVGLGIGSGIMLQGSLYRGGLGFAPKLGHTLFKAGGRICGCGLPGCFEMYASEISLVEHYRGTERQREDDGEIWKQAGGIIRLAAGGDAKARDSVLHIGEMLGIGIASTINLLNPGHVFIGSRMNRVDGFVETVKASIVSHVLPMRLNGMTIMPSPFADESVSLGAASLAIEHIFSVVKVG